jgi:hypothetical protein
MSYGLEMCSSFAAAPAAGGSSISTYVFVLISIEKALPLLAPLPLADSVVTLPLAHLERMSYRTTCMPISLNTVLFLIVTLTRKEMHGCLSVESLGVFVYFIREGLCH